MDHYFQLGNTLSQGRPKGVPNRRSTELERRLRERGDVDPADYCSSIVSSPTEPTELKLAAANNLLPYLYSKRGAMPPPRFVDTPIQVPDFTSIEVAESFLAKIATLVAGGELDIQTGLELSTLTKNWIDSRHAAKELDLKIISVEGGPHEQTIRIEGGLPTLPGCENLIMPQLNGHAVSEQLLAAPVDVVNESVPPGEAKAQGPHPLQKHHFEEPKTESSPTNGGGEPTP